MVLQARLGGLERDGGWRRQPGAVDLAVAPAARVRGREPVVGSRWPAISGTLPSAVLADDAELRALVVVGGDPASSLPDTGRAARALRSLELLVTLDLFETPTSRMGHALLPAATWLEREETAYPHGNQRPAAHLRLDCPWCRRRGRPGRTSRS